MLTIVWAFTCHCLFAVGGSGLDIWWLLTNQGGYCWRSGQLWQFLKIGQEQGLPHRLTLPAWTTSLQPTRYLAALDQIVENFFQNWSQSFQTVPLLYHLSLCNILSPLLLFQQTSQHFHQQTSQLCLKTALLGSSIRSDLSTQALSREAAITSRLQGLLLILVLLLFTISAVTSSTEVLKPLEVIYGGWIQRLPNSC